MAGRDQADSPQQELPSEPTLLRCRMGPPHSVTPRKPHPYPYGAAMHQPRHRPAYVTQPLRPLYGTRQRLKHGSRPQLAATHSPATGKPGHDLRSHTGHHSRYTAIAATRRISIKATLPDMPSTTKPRAAAAPAAAPAQPACPSRAQCFQLRAPYQIRAAPRGLASRGEQALAREAAADRALPHLLAPRRSPGMHRPHQRPTSSGSQANHVQGTLWRSDLEAEPGLWRAELRRALKSPLSPAGRRVMSRQRCP